MGRFQRGVEAVISFSRRLIVPMLLGLVTMLGVLACLSMIQLWKVIKTFPSATDSELIAGPAC